MALLMNRSAAGALCGSNARNAVRSPMLVSRVAASPLPRMTRQHPLLSPPSAASSDAIPTSVRPAKVIQAPSAAFQEHMKQMMQDNAEITVTVVAAATNGVKVLYGDHEGFVHSYCLGDAFKVSKGADMVGKELVTKATGFDEAQGTWLFKVILSLGSLEEGQVVSGTWASVKTWGAFVALPGCQGLVHNTRFSSTSIRNMKSRVKTGDAVKAFVLEVDQTRGQVMLSTKVLELAPGDMCNNPEAVYAAAEETGAALRAKFAEASRTTPGLKMSEFFST